MTKDELDRWLTDTVVHGLDHAGFAEMDIEDVLLDAFARFANMDEILAMAAQLPSSRSLADSDAEAEEQSLKFATAVSGSDRLGSFPWLTPNSNAELAGALNSLDVLPNSIVGDGGLVRDKICGLLYDDCSGELDSLALLRLGIDPANIGCMNDNSWVVVAGKFKAFWYSANNHSEWRPSEENTK